MLTDFTPSKGRETLFDESDGLIRRGSIINSNLSRAYQTEEMFFKSGRETFWVRLYLFYSPKKLISTQLFRRAAPSCIKQ